MQVPTQTSPIYGSSHRPQGLTRYHVNMPALCDYVLGCFNTSNENAINHYYENNIVAALHKAASTAIPDPMQLFKTLLERGIIY